MWINEESVRSEIHLILDTLRLFLRITLTKVTYQHNILIVAIVCRNLKRQMSHDKCLQRGVRSRAASRVCPTLLGHWGELVASAPLSH